MEANSTNNREKARALFDVAVDEYFAEQTTEISSIERVYNWIHKSFEMDSSLANEPHVINFMGNLCSLLAWFCEDENLEEKSRSYYREAIGFLERLEDPCWHEYWYLGKALGVMGEAEKAEKILKMALDLAVPGNQRGHDPSESELASLWGDLADLYTEIEQPTDARECLEWAFSYAPDDEGIRAALIFHCFFTNRFEQGIQLCQSVTPANNMFPELLAMGACLAGDIELAKQTYIQLLNKTESSDAREWYSKMLGYSEGLSDAGIGQRIWSDKEEWQWEFHAGDKNELKEMSLDEMGNKLREEMRDNTIKIGVQMFQVKEEMGRLSTFGQERVHIRSRLEQDVFGELWKTLDKASQAALVDAEYQSAEAKGSQKQDCSSPAVMYQKAIEIEISDRIIAPFQSFLLSRGQKEWNIASERRLVRHLKTLDLPKVCFLLTGWRLVKNRPASITKEELRFFPTEPDSEKIQQFLTLYDPKQLAFLLVDLPDFLAWAPNVGTIAKHRDIVHHETLIKLRSQLIGSQIKPGVLIKLVQLFPSSGQKSENILGPR